MHDVFKCHRLKIKSVGSIVVRAHRFRVAVDHDCLKPIFLQRKSGMDTAVIEFDSLPNSVRPTTQDYNFFIFGRDRLAFRFVGGIKIGSMGFEFTPTGIDSFKDRFNSITDPLFSHLVLLASKQTSYILVGITSFLGAFYQISGQLL